MGNHKKVIFKPRIPCDSMSLQLAIIRKTQMQMCRNSNLTRTLLMGTEIGIAAIASSVCYSQKEKKTLKIELLYCLTIPLLDI